MSLEREVYITGLGVLCPLGIEGKAVVERLKQGQHGLQRWQPLGLDTPSPVKVAGRVEGFDFSSSRPMGWSYPEGMLPAANLRRVLPPSGIFAHFALEQALEDAGLTKADINDGKTGLFTAHAGSSELMHRHLAEMENCGWKRSHPTALLRSAPGLLNWHFAAHYGIQGSVCGFLSACSSSSHALGYAMDEIRLGRQERMIVVSGEDLAPETYLPFHSLAALSTEENPDLACLPFDRRRNGFVPGSGGACLILESKSAVMARKARVRAQLKGWGQASDGHHPVHPQPKGAGLRKAAQLCLQDAKMTTAQVDGVNAHAPSTQAGDAAEARALLDFFGKQGARPPVSSTKAFTGHSLCLAGVLESVFSVLCLEQGFLPAQKGSTQIDEVTEDLFIPAETQFSHPQSILKLTSGFGGTNVALVFSKA